MRVKRKTGLFNHRPQGVEPSPKQKTRWRAAGKVTLPDPYNPLSGKEANKQARVARGGKNYKHIQGTRTPYSGWARTNKELSGETGKKQKYRAMKDLRNRGYSAGRKGKLPGKIGQAGAVTLRGMSNLLGPAIAVEAGSAAIRNASAIAKKRQTASQTRAIGRQDTKLKKKYMKKDPKKQAVFKKLMNRRTKITQR